MGLGNFGKWLVGLGIFLLIAGLILIGLERLGWKGWRMPGDIAYERDGFRFYFPLGTSLFLSLLISLILILIAWLSRVLNR